MRLASRIANSLGAGYPVDDIDSVTACRVVLLSLPDDKAGEVISQLAASRAMWRGKSVLLASEALDSSELAPLAKRGASTASLAVVPGVEQMFVFEGDRLAVREARRIVESAGPPRQTKALVVLRSRKALYCAGLSFATTLFTPLIVAAAESLGASGVAHADSVDLAQRVFQKSLRAYSKAGRKGWEGPLAEGNYEAVRRQMHALRGARPLLARYYYENAVLALQLLGKDPSWMQRLAPAAAKAAG